MNSPATRATAVPAGRPGPAAGIIPFPGKTTPGGSSGLASATAHTARPTVEALRPSVHIRPDGGVRRQATAWGGLAGEAIRVITDDPFEVTFQAPFHLLVAYEPAVRRAGETVVPRFARSTLHKVSHKLTFV